ncbi:hypothetical protein ACJX0J_006404, partial [Zea mays]
EEEVNGFTFNNNNEVNLWIELREFFMMVGYCLSGSKEVVMPVQMIWFNCRETPHHPKFGHPHY